MSKPRLLAILAAALVGQFATVSAALAQNGYSVSDYKPHTLNDDYKPGQGLIFHNSGTPSVFAPSPSHSPSSNVQPVYRPAYQTTPASPSKPISSPAPKRSPIARPKKSAKVSSAAESGAAPKSESANAMLPTKSGAETKQVEKTNPLPESAKKKTATTNSATTTSETKSVEPKPVESKPVESKTTPTPALTPASTPAVPVKLSPAPDASQPAGVVAAPEAKPKVETAEKPLPAKFLAPHPLTAAEFAMGLAALVLYGLSIFATIYLMRRTREEAEEYVESIRPLHSVLLRRSPGPNTPPYIPATMSLAHADGTISSRDRFKPVGKKSRSTVESNLASFKAKLEETIVPEMVGSERPRKNPWIAVALSVFPGAGQIYLGQRKRGIYLLIAAFFINPAGLMINASLGVALLCYFCMKMHIVISQDVAHLLNSCLRSKDSMGITGALLFIFLLIPAAYDAYKNARAPKVQKVGERSLFDIAALSVLLVLVGFIILFLVAIFLAPPSTTGALTKTTYIELVLHDPESPAPPEKATESMQTSNNQVKPSHSNLDSVIVSAARPKSAAKVGSESQSTKPDDISQDIKQSTAQVDHDSPALKSRPNGDEAESAHLHSLLGDEIKRSDAAAGAVDPPAISNRDEHGEIQEKLKGASQNPNQKILELPAVDSLPETVSTTDSQKALQDAKDALKKNNVVAAYMAIQKAVESDARSAMAYRLKAIIEERLSMPNRAMDDSAKALALDSKDSEMFILRSRVLNDYLSDYAGAVVSANQALALTPDSAEAYAARGASRLKLDDLTGAQQDLFSAMNINGLCPAALVLKADTRYYFGDAIGALDEAGWATDEDSNYAKGWLARAKYSLDVEPATCMSHTDGKQAMNYVEKALTLEPRNPIANCLWAEATLAFVDNGDGPAGIDLLFKALDHLTLSEQVLPTADGYYVQALIRSAQGSNAAARSLFNEVLVLEPNTLKREPKFAIRQLFNTQDSAKQDVEKITKKIAISPKDSSLYWNRCLAYDSLKENDKAIADVTTYIALMPYKSDGYEVRAKLNRRLGRNKESVEDEIIRYKLEKDPKTGTGEAGAAARSCGETYRLLKDYRSAAFYFTQSAEIDKGHLDALGGSGLYANLGQTYFDLGEYDNALKCARIARQYDPANPFGETNEGESLYMLGQPEAAEAVLKAGSELFLKQDDKVNAGEATYYLGLVHKALKRDDDAAKEFARAKELGFIYTPPKAK